MEETIKTYKEAKTENPCNQGMVYNELLERVQPLVIAHQKKKKENTSLLPEATKVEDKSSISSSEVSNSMA